MFPDPMTGLSINSVAQSLPRVSMGDLKGIYQTNDEVFKMTISHTVQGNGRVRSLVRLDHRKIVTNPLDSSNDFDTASIQLIIDRPAYGFSVTEIDYDVQGLKGWATTAFVTKLFGKES